MDVDASQDGDLYIWSADTGVLLVDVWNRVNLSFQRRALLCRTQERGLLPMNGYTDLPTTYQGMSWTDLPAFLAQISLHVDVKIPNTNRPKHVCR